ncbi:hypothetical protein WCD74_01205 [Actinomycetospora sp. OC33-EN08]|uniref:Uncharacterized protein n=1 Tax=Actinomycetospora aurantiaca TaxID=3129233 RepID=A0ABU8MHA5_9PSEU
MSTARGLWAWRLPSALALLAVGAIHLYLVATSTGGLLGVLFTLQGIGALVLAGAMLALRGRLFPLATVLSLLFMAGSWLALVLALTVGLFGLRSSLSYDLAPTSLVVETLGTVLLAVTAVKAVRGRRG